MIPHVVKLTFLPCLHSRFFLFRRRIEAVTSPNRSISSFHLSLLLGIKTGLRDQFRLTTSVFHPEVAVWRLIAHNPSFQHGGAISRLFLGPLSIPIFGDLLVQPAVIPVCFDFIPYSMILSVQDFGFLPFVIALKFAPRWAPFKKCNST